jgi:hypothetical protein
VDLSRDQQAWIKNWKATGSSAQQVAMLCGLVVGAVAGQAEVEP